MMRKVQVIGNETMPYTFAGATTDSKGAYKHAIVVELGAIMSGPILYHFGVKLLDDFLGVFLRDRSPHL